MDYPNWAIPYIYKLCDEYVIEILEIIYVTIKKQDLKRFRDFCFENKHEFVKSYSRMTSYWNEYYRCISFKDYVGKKMFWECFGYSRSIEKQRKSGLDSFV
jgi:hypothetical protein